MADDRWRDDDRQRWDNDRDRYYREGTDRESTRRQEFGRHDYDRDESRRWESSRRDREQSQGSQGYGENRSYSGNRSGSNYGRNDYGSGGRSSGRDYGSSNQNYGQNHGRGDYGSGGSYSGYGYGGYGSANYGDPSRNRDWTSGYGAAEQRSSYGDSERERSWRDRHWNDRNDRYSDYDYNTYPDYGYGMGMAWSAGLAEWPAPVADWRSGYSQDWRRAQNYRDARDYGGQRGGQYAHERGWWDRTKDEVRSWMGDEEAERRRRQDYYAESGQRPNYQRVGHYGRGPKGYSRSDQRITEDVNDRLTDDWRVDASEIEVTVASGEVTLTGTVDSREAKRRAENIAADVTGVKDVQNNLRVRQPTYAGTSSTSSTTLAGSSPTALDQTPGLSSSTSPASSNATSSNATGTSTRPKH